MKKYKVLGAMSLALIGGGALATIPLAMTSCSKDKSYYSFPSKTITGSQAQLAAGIKIGTISKDNGDIVNLAGHCLIAPTSSFVGHIYIYGEYDKSSTDKDNGDIFMQTISLQTGAQAAKAPFTIDVWGKNPKDDALTTDIVYFSLTITA